MNKIHVLIVEDEMIFAHNLQINLEKTGCTVDGVVRSGDDALIAVDRRKPDLVMMDIHIEGSIDGIETALQMKRRDIPVIFLTAFGDKETLERAKIAEPFGYLTKPVDFQQLPYAIEIAACKHRMGKRLRENEHLMSAILFSIADAVIATDPSDSIVLINPSGESLTGWSSADAVGQPIKTVFNTECSPVEEASIQTSVSGQNEMTLIHRDGRSIPVRVSRSDLNDDAGQHLGSVVVFHDITEQKRFERDREAYILDLKAAMASIKTLSGLIPICANCKKIRTDTGYWMQVEQYVKEHSNADFTHSICPQCISELYPKFVIPESDQE